MAYSSSGKKPFERASKSSHHHIINDEEVKNLVERCWLPPIADEIDIGDSVIQHTQKPENNPIDFIVAVDGGYTETVVRPEYPSSSLCFMQFGALLFSKHDLEEIEKIVHPAPEDMTRLKRLERLKLALPVRNIRLEHSQSLKESVRQTVHEFFESSVIEGESLSSTLAWLVFEGFQPTSKRKSEWRLATNPNSALETGALLKLAEMDGSHTFPCPDTNNRIYLADVLRLHEAVDEERGAGGILGYLVNSIEHIIIAHLIRMLLKQDPKALKRVLLIKDGPLGLFGQTANLHKPMRSLIRFLAHKHDINLVGVEKSGAFVDHAAQVQSKLAPGSALILNNDYIYRYILPGQADPDRPYGDTTNYGHKVIFKTRGGQPHVISVPSENIVASPAAENLLNLQTILSCVEALHCSMYDSALFPVALANKLVSLSAHPSQRILQRFAKSSVTEA